MTDIVERLHVVRDQLRTGRFGQREVWEEWLAEAAAEIERLRKTAIETMQEMLRRANEIERLREHVDALRLVATANEPEALRQQAEIERLLAVLRAVADYRPGGDHQAVFAAVRRALESRP